MCKYLFHLIGFNTDEPEDYYDSEMKLSIISYRYMSMKYILVLQNRNTHRQSSCQF